MLSRIAYTLLVLGLTAGLVTSLSRPIPDDPCTGTSAPSVGPAPGEFSGLAAELVTDDLDEPSDVMHLPGTDTLLVTEKPGRVVAVVAGEKLEEPVLDIEDRVIDKSNEQGLLTLEPHPGFAENCIVYLFYTDLAGHSNLMEARVSGTEKPVIDPRTFRGVLFVPQVHQYHQSGSIAFDGEGNMWVSIGDGGSRADRRAHSQDPTTIKATVIRINDSELPYGIPADNPFVGSDEGADEVWGYGLRNPWRITIDAETNQLYLPDVGSAGSEEINVVSLDDAGLNFGWDITEGTTCYDADECDTTGLRLPDYEYLHAGYGCAVIGGGVYRGAAIPELHGHYFFGDFCLGWVNSLIFEDGKVIEVFDWESDLGRLGRITSFGTDENGEWLVTSLDGELWRLVPVRQG